MKVKELITLVFVTACTMSCIANEPEYINPDNKPTDATAFVKGADISWVTKMESEKIEFFNNEGEARECTQLMKEIGMNSVRYRVWVNPKEGWNNKADVLAKAMRAQALGMRIMIDFHYSDTWADPGHQATPLAWKDYSLQALKEAMSEHTIDVLSTLKKHDVEVEWVQVGNETRGGMMYPLGQVDYNNANFAQLVSTGYDAVKSVYPEAQVIVHLDGGDNLGLYTYIFDYLKDKGGKYDMIGMSLYPQPDSWKVAAQKCIANINTVAEKYGKPVMICEIGLIYNQAQTTKDMLTFMIEQSRNNTNGACKGIFYWEPQAPAGYNGGYDKGAFEHGKPTIALDPFKD